MPDDGAAGRDGAGRDGAGRDRADAAVRAALGAAELEHRVLGPGSYLVSLPGTHRLSTPCWLTVGARELRVQAFVMRHADEGRERLYDFLLHRNARAHGVAFALDAVGDVYLVGEFPLVGVGEEEVDRLLGAVLTAADENFDTMLRLGFGSSIRREWAWRRRRGESLENLRAFASFAADPDPDPADPGPGARP